MIHVIGYGNAVPECLSSLFTELILSMFVRRRDVKQNELFCGSFTPDLTCNPCCCFNALFVRSVVETVSIILGRSVSEAFVYHLQAYLGMTLDEMLYDTEGLFKALKDSFGIAGDVLARRIIKVAYGKAGITFNEGVGLTLVEQVELLKQKMADRSV